MSQVIPEGWLEQPIGNIADVVAGGTPKAGDPKNFAMSGTAIAWLTPADLSKYNSKSISHGARDLSQEGYDSSSAKLMPKGALLFSSRAPIGYVVIAENPICTNQGFKNFVFTEQVDSTYAFYYLKSIRDLAESLGSGTTFKELSGATAKTIPFRLAPLAEQKVIADKLDELLAQVESTKARLDAIPAILKSFRQSVLSAAVSGKLTEEWRVDKKLKDNAVFKVQEYKKHWVENNREHNEVSRVSKRLKAFANQPLSSEKLPDNWSWTKLEDSVLMIVDCHNKTAPYVEQGVPLIRTSNIRDGQFVWKDLKYVNQETFSYWSKRCIPASGDIIFTREAPMGEAAIIPENIQMCLGQRTMLIRPIELCVSARYLLAAIMDPMFKKRSEEFAVGTGVKHYRVGDVSNLLIPVPPTEEQAEIVRRVEELFAFSDKVEEQVNAAQSRVNNLTQSILAKAFRGELTAEWRAANPDLISGKNSAEALFELIKAERETLVKASKGARKKPVKKVIVKNTQDTVIDKKMSPVESAIANGSAHNPQEIFDLLTPGLSMSDVFNEISKLLTENKIEEKTVDGITGFFVKK